MSQISSSSKKGVFSATVLANRQIGQRFHRLRLEFSADGARAFAQFKPGQFTQVDLSSAALPPEQDTPADLLDASRRELLLRRPFSFADVTAEGDKTFAELLYCVVGPATLRMTTLSSGDRVSIIGPLGNGFRILGDKKTALLVVGGMGAPPLQHLAKTLTSEHAEIEVVAFAGAKAASELPFEGRLDEISQQLGFSLPEFTKYGINSIVATDDGSAGYRGLVTDRLQQWLDEKSGLTPDSVIIYSCGPEAMLAKVAEIARDKGIDCQVSMERRMACGIGLCQSCAVECRVDDSSQTTYKLCCEDGPVFDGREVVFV
ncbi:MAG: dihydroorotate dehydrogenase electron transfer subunit [Phycisphaerales bacterium]|nr:MAG: dihydroorotate dehydrogenase electron transfer subunit [Phycisphaerales bacterium]